MLLQFSLKGVSHGLLWGALSMRHVGILLAVGATGLTLMLVVLSRTRWGEAKPFSKCILLSVFAHLLLFIYAYDTELPRGPAGGSRAGESVTSVQLLDEDFGEWTEATPFTVPPPDAVPVPSNEPPLPPEMPAEMPRAADAVTPAEHPAPEAFTAQPRSVEAPTPAPPLPAESTAIKPPADPEPPAEQGDPLPPLAESAPAASSATDGAAEMTETPQPPADSSLVEASPADAANDPSSPEMVHPLPAPTHPVSMARPAELEVVPATRPLRADGTPVPPVYSHRLAPQRSEIAARYGGTAETEAAVQRALLWFAANQSRDGRWDADQFGAGNETRSLGHDRNRAGAQADTGLSALATLAYLGAGQTHQHGEYQDTVRRALQFLMSQQAADGNLAGAAELFARMYCHGMATLALAEAFVLTQDPQLRPALERAVTYTVRSQHPQTGGWRYLPGDPGDMSQFGWQVMALKSAEQAGIMLPTRTQAGMRKFLQSVSSGNQRGLVSYRVGERVSRPMTAEGLACRWFLHVPHDQRAIDEAANFVVQELPRSDRENFYAWYYATLALFHLQDERWQLWNAALQQELLSSQRVDPDLAGSWDPDPIWGGYGGRLYSTALATLCLEVYYRYAPDVPTASP